MATAELEVAPHPPALVARTPPQEETSESRRSTRTRSAAARQQIIQMSDADVRESIATLQRGVKDAYKVIQSVREKADQSDKALVTVGERIETFKGKLSMGIGAAVFAFIIANLLMVVVCACYWSGQPLQTWLLILCRFFILASVALTSFSFGVALYLSI